MIAQDACPAHVLEPLNAKVNVVYDPSEVVDDELAQPKLEVELTLLSALAVALRHAQFLAILELLDTVGRMERQHRFRNCGRPKLTPAEDAGAWWAYAARAITVQRRTERVVINWAELSLRRQYRLMYVGMYTDWLECPESIVHRQQLDELEEDYV